MSWQPTPSTSSSCKICEIPYDFPDGIIDAVDWSACRKSAFICAPKPRRWKSAPELRPKASRNSFKRVSRSLSRNPRSRVFREREYAVAGAKIVPAGSWRIGCRQHHNIRTEGPPGRWIRAAAPTHHVRACVQGPAWMPRLSLSDFERGGGSLYDLEYLVDESGRRLAAFGYWAGYAGAAVALLALASVRADVPMPDLTIPRRHRDELKREVAAAVEAVVRKALRADYRHGPNRFRRGGTPQVALASGCRLGLAGNRKRRPVP